MDDTAVDLIGNALRYGGIVNYDAAIPGEMIQRGISALNDIITKWATKAVYLPYQSTLAIPLVAGQQNYTVGTSGGEDVNSNPIMDIVSIVINDTASPNVDYKASTLTEQYYANIPYKASQGIPGTVLLRNYQTYSELFFQTVPYSSNLTANLVCKQKLTEVLIGSTLTGLASESKMALKMELLRLAGGIWGKKPTADQLEMAKESVQSYLASNLSTVDLTIRKGPRLNGVSELLFNYWVNP